MSEKTCRTLVHARATPAQLNVSLCEVCSLPGQSVHHRLKRSAGGLWEPANCILVCGNGVTGCHGRIEHNPGWAESEGLALPPWGIPEDVPLIRWGTWVYLNNDGSVTPWTKM